MKKRIVALLMTLVMVVSVMPINVFAENAHDHGLEMVTEVENIKYVSLGDSMTNGFGLNGYDGYSGVANYGYESYANRFAAWLAGVDFQTWLSGGSDDDGRFFAGVNGNVFHGQLAMSALRVEDLHFLLEFDYNDTSALALTEYQPSMDGYFNSDFNSYSDAQMAWWKEVQGIRWSEKFDAGDYWTWDMICSGSRVRNTTDAILATGYADFPDTYNPEQRYVNDVGLIAKYYQDQIAGADIISLGIGTGNFGTFLLERVAEAANIAIFGKAEDVLTYDIESAVRSLDIPMQVMLLNLLDTVDALLIEYGIEVNDGSDTVSTMEAMAHVIKYCVISYAINYVGVIDGILECNPDAEVILVGLMNTMEVDDTEVEGISMGCIMEMLYKPLNAFIAAVPAVMQQLSVGADAEFYYASTDVVKCLADDYDILIEDPNSVVRDRFVQDIVGSGNSSGLVWSLMTGAGLNLNHITLDEVNSYASMAEDDKLTYANTYPQKALALSVYMSFEKTIVQASQESDAGLLTLLNGGEILSGNLFAGVLQYMSEHPTDKVEYLPVVYQIVAAEFPAIALNFSETQFAGLMTTPGAELHMPELAPVLTYAKLLWTMTADSTVMMSALQSDSVVTTLLGLFGRSMLGNCIGVHPSVEGHEALFVAVRGAYQIHTAQDETLQNLVATVDLLKQWIPEYYDEAYAYAYAYAAENGYVDVAINAIDVAIDTIKSIDLSGTQITASSQANIATELAAVVATLEEIKAALANGEAQDVIGLVNTVMALEDDLYVHLYNLDVFAKQAGANIYELVYLPVKAIVVNEVIPAATAAAKVILTKVHTRLTEKVNEIYGIVIDVNTTVTGIIDAVRDHIDHITGGEFEYSTEMFYLAIEDSNNGYADLVAEALGLSEDQYKKITSAELTFEDLSKATFITVGYNTVSVVDFTVEQMLGVANKYVVDAEAFIKAVDEKLETGMPKIMEMINIDVYDFVMELVNAEAGQYLALVEGKEVTELDWINLIGAENVVYVETLKAELRAALIENGIPEIYTPVDINIVELANAKIAELTDGLLNVSEEQLYAILGEHATFTLDIPVADLVVFAAESALYEFISCNKAYSDTILTINAINPDASVAVLGNYNRYAVNYEFVTAELNFTLAEVLSEFGFEGFTLPAEAKEAIAAIAAIGVYEINIPVGDKVDAVVDKYNEAVDFVVNIDLPVSEAELALAALVNIGNAYVAEVTAKIDDVYTISIPVADFVAMVMDQCDLIDDMINASLNTTITIDSMTIEANDVLDLLANITSIHPFVYAAMFHNMFYVDISGALYGGDAYIADQILSNMTVSCDHEYDDCNDTICNLCGAEREPAAHSFTIYVSDNNASCGVNGTKTAYCDYGCGTTHTIEDEGSALTHSYKVVSATAGDCKTAGTITYACVHCGHSYTATGALGDHVATGKATCTTSKRCAVCGEILARATGHKPGAAATCTTAQTCTVCGEVLAEALGHKAGAAATCTTAQTCTVCNAVIAEALGHKAGAAATCTADQKCTVCGEVLAKATGHKAGSAATCTADQKCTVCGEVLAKATGHKAGSAATCTADQKCTVCGTVLAKATGHKWTDATCKAPKTCSVCKATEGTTAAHKFGDWVVTKEAAAGVAGEKTRTCSVCGATETEVIEALPVEPTTDPVVEPTEPTEPSEPTEPTEPKDGLSTGAIIGISAASVTVAGGAAVAIWFALKKKIF